MFGVYFLEEKESRSAELQRYFILGDNSELGSIKYIKQLKSVNIFADVI